MLTMNEDLSEVKDFIDVYSIEGEYLGVKNRSLVHDEGLLHYAIHCWVFGYFNGRLAVVFQKRKATKRLFPDKYDVAAAGHYLAGEYGRDGLRELTEELGVPINNYDICYHETINCQHYDNSIANNELCNVYFCKLNCKLTDLKFDPQEIEDLIFVDIKDGLSLLMAKTKEILVYSLNQKANIKVTIEDFIDEYKSYFIDTLSIISEKPDICDLQKNKKYTFVMLKPDAIKRNLVPDIISFLKMKGYSIELFNVKIAADDTVYLHYKDKIIEEGDIYKTKAYAYFHNNYVVPMVISHNSDDIIQYTRKLVGFKDPQFAEKDSIRGKWGIDSMQCSEKEIRCCENLIHASDSIKAFKRECLIWFKRTDVERFFT